MNKLASTVTLLGLLLPAPALAKSSFPQQIQDHLGPSTAPGCIVCHGTNAGGGPISQPFGQSMLAAGLNSSGGDSLTSALDKLAADKADSNGDGVGDIDELKAGLDPNPDKPPISYGCGGGRIAPKGRLGWPASIMAILTFAFLSYRTSRKARHFREREIERAFRV